jgi:hypothetical protein
VKRYDFISSVYAAPSHQQRTPTPAAAKTFGDMQVAKTGISTTPVVEGVSLAVKQAQAELSKLTIPARGAASTTRAVGMPASATCRTLTVIVAESQLHQAEVSLLIW